MKNDLDLLKQLDEGIRVLKGTVRREPIARPKPVIPKDPPKDFTKILDSLCYLDPEFEPVLRSLRGIATTKVIKKLVEFYGLFDKIDSTLMESRRTEVKILGGKQARSRFLTKKRFEQFLASDPNLEKTLQELRNAK